MLLVKWEIEKKYIIDSLPINLNPYKSVLIEQTYLVITKDSNTRVRKITNLNDEKISYTFTYKYGSAPKRKEEEFEIDSKTYQGFLEKINGSPLLKERNHYKYNNSCFTIDTYKNPSIKGLIIAEVEFKNDSLLEQYIPPTWFGKEVTGVKQYGNKHLWKIIQD